MLILMLIFITCVDCERNRSTDINLIIRTEAEEMGLKLNSECINTGDSSGGGGQTVPYS